MDYFRILVWIEYAEGHVQAWKHESWNVLGKCVGKIFGMYMKERIGWVGTVQSLWKTWHMDVMSRSSYKLGGRKGVHVDI
jgi:hypothetical protein